MTGVIEVDGPPCAMFEYPDNGVPVRLVYRSFVWRGNNPRLLAITMHQKVDEIFNAALAVSDTPVVFWRRRPILSYQEPVELQSVGSDNAMEAYPGFWRASFRVVVAPDLSADTWQLLGTMIQGGECPVEVTG